MSESHDPLVFEETRYTNVIEDRLELKTDGGVYTLVGYEDGGSFYAKVLLNDNLIIEHDFTSPPPNESETKYDFNRAQYAKMRAVFANQEKDISAQVFKNNFKDYLPVQVETPVFKAKKKSSGSAPSVLVNITQFLKDQSQNLVSEGLMRKMKQAPKSGDECTVYIYTDNNVGGHKIAYNERNHVWKDWKNTDYSGYGLKDLLSKVLNPENSAQKLTKINNLLHNFIQAHPEALSENQGGLSIKNKVSFPFESKDGADAVIGYMKKYRHLSEEVSKEMFDRGIVKYADYIRNPDSRYGTGVSSSHLYFPLTNVESDLSAIQKIEISKGKGAQKLNSGSTQGAVSIIPGTNPEALIITEAAFDNIALYEILGESKRDRSKFDLVSCQSVGNVPAYFRERFGVGESKKDGSIVALTQKNIDVPLSEDEYLSLKREFNRRRFVYITDGSDASYAQSRALKVAFESAGLIKGLNIIKKEDFIKDYSQVEPTDIVLDSRSFDVFLKQNNLSLNVDSSKPVLKLTETKWVESELTPEKIKEVCAELPYNTLVSGVDNDEAGDVPHSFIKKVSKKLGLKFVDWRASADLKDHNEALKQYKSTGDKAFVSHVPLLNKKTPELSKHKY